MIYVENQQIIMNCNSSVHIWYKTVRHIQNVRSPFYGIMSQCFTLCHTCCLYQPRDSTVCAGLMTLTLLNEVSEIRYFALFP